MASPAHIESAELLAPIPGDEPAGVPTPLVMRQKLDLARRDEEPHPDDPTQAPIPKKPDWSFVVKTCLDLLAQKSKDLNLAARLTEGLARQHGFAGLRDGLRLLGDLVEQCWDNDPALEKPRLHPAPDEGEGMEVRAGPFHWLSDTDRGARFPNSVHDLPLLSLNGSPVSWNDKKRSEEGKGEIAASDFDRCAPYRPETAADLKECLDELARLDSLLGAKLAQDAPGLMGLQQALDDCNGLLKNILRKQPGGMEEAGMSNGEEAEASTPAESRDLGKLPSSRGEAYDQLSRIANLLEKLEPHSPIPDLIRRAVELGRMPFRQLIRELIRDGGQLAEVRREFGIKEAEGGG